MKYVVVLSALVGLANLCLASPTNLKRTERHGEHKEYKWPGPFHFTSTYAVVATPDQFINGTVPTLGEPNAIGYFNYGINSELDVICYNITLKGVTGPYQSMALTATHIHEAARGASGPPRIAFPNPGPADSGPDVIKRSIGCLTGPFRTGIVTAGRDSGEGFIVRQIEDDPEAFFTDAHTSMYVPGVVRGQLGKGGKC